MPCTQGLVNTSWRWRGRSRPGSTTRPWPRCWSNGIGLLANFHLAASLPNCDWLEIPNEPPAFTHEGRDRLLAAPLRVDADGTVRIPDRPRLGIVLDEAYIAHLRGT